MSDDEKLLKKRLTEKHERALSRGIAVYSDFLTMAEQDTLLSLGLFPAPELSGGYPGAERRVAVFGAGEDADITPPSPVKCVKISPLSAKFAEKLTHRDYLGALMSLGIKRETLGDIAVSGCDAYLFCLDNISGFICSELTEVRRTPVKCSVTEAPEELVNAQPEERETVVPSLRADALVAAVYRLSRGEAQELFTRGLVFLNSRLLENGAKTLSENDVVSVRGHGRFIFTGESRETKKGRIRAAVKVF